MPPVWPRPRPDTIGTATPHAATAGASGIEILSPTPPVECLSTFARAIADRSMTSPERVIASAHVASSRSVEALEEDRHQHRRDLVVGDRAVGEARDEEADLGVVERATVALLADQLDGKHQYGPMKLSDHTNNTAASA